MALQNWSNPIVDFASDMYELQKEEVHHKTFLRTLDKMQQIHHILR